MRCGECRVKWLDAKCRRVRGKSRWAHQRDRSKTTNVPVVNRASVVEHELNGRVLPLVLRQISRIDEQRAGEPRLHDDAILAREVEHDQLRSAPAALDRRPARTLDEFG